ncbi:ferredoxin III, nif-specific [Pleomorphomonas sp. NRK KF1]|uniref:ferredoxin III, nif-specific n=1 Tax=Pleomorphomonas sp. NRK KF1 TaxID=2943000 RepID=UPI0035313E11
MADYTTRDGSPWTPLFLVSIDGGACIGCARCFKVCDRDVMHLYGVDDEGEILGKVVEDDDDDFDGELNRKIMVADNDGACIGCNACARVCPKNCQSHAPPDKLAA